MTPSCRSSRRPRPPDPPFRGPVRRRGRRARGRGPDGHRSRGSSSVVRYARALVNVFTSARVLYLAEPSDRTRYGGKNRPARTGRGRPEPGSAEEIHAVDSSRVRRLGDRGRTAPPDRSDDPGREFGRFLPLGARRGAPARCPGCMTSADPASRTSSSTLARAGVRRRGRRTRAALLVPGVAAGLLLAGVVAADAATSTSTLAVCLKRGAPMVAPTASGSCPSGYTLTRVVGARGPAGATGASPVPGDPRVRTARAERPERPERPEPLVKRERPGRPGPQGDAGPQGDVGPQGLMGPEGPEGAEGAQGDAGPQGDVGPHGDVGPQGLMGPAGPAGADGTAPGRSGSTPARPPSTPPATPTPWPASRSRPGLTS